MIEIFNEVKYVENLLQTGEIKVKNRDIYMIAIYNKLYKNMKPKQNKQFLIDFSTKYIDGFDIDIDANLHLINSALNQTTKKNLMMKALDYIGISEEFVDYFDSLKIDYTLKKVLFVLACWAKINKEIGRYYNYAKSKKNFSDLKQSCVLETKCNIITILRELANNKFIRVCNKGSLELIFLGEWFDGEPLHMVEDLEHIGLWFDLHCGFAIQCENCGKIEKKKNYKFAPNQKYCSKCRIEKNKYWKREYKKKQKN